MIHSPTTYDGSSPEPLHTLYLVSNSLYHTSVAVWWNPKLCNAPQTHGPRHTAGSALLSSRSHKHTPAHSNQSID